MGIYNSSLYRMLPLAKTIIGNQENFERLLFSVGVTGIVCPSDPSDYFYGDREKQLKPPKAHLEKLIDYIAKKDFRELAVKGISRAALCGKYGTAARNAAKREAFRCLQQTYDRETLPKAWYIFEGMTCPDLYIEGENDIILCEGKWTEKHITEKTAHLSAPDEYRNQMVRHIQGAMNASKKRIIAFYIADENCGYTDCMEKTAFRKQLEKETISLSPEEREAIFSCFYGYTTWQVLEKQIPNLSFPDKSEINNS